MIQNLFKQHIKTSTYLIFFIAFASCGGGDKALEAFAPEPTYQAFGSDEDTIAHGDGSIFASTTTPASIVFVSRPTFQRGSIYAADNVTRGIPGVGAGSRFVAAPGGKLIVCPITQTPSAATTSKASCKTLIDGANPTPASLNIVDVNAPDVDYDGKTIAFAGLVKDQFDTNATKLATNANGWRLFIINADGTGLKQLTNSDMVVDGTQFTFNSNLGYDDHDPAWLPYNQGEKRRLVFSSSRWFSFGQYSGVVATNLFVINDDGTGMHRITSERNSADRPQIDPVTGKIVYARWWRNHRFPAQTFKAKTTENDRWGDGLTSSRSATGDEGAGGNLNADSTEMFRNAWHAAAIDPDGQGLSMWTGYFRNEGNTHMYGGTFVTGGDFIANFPPLPNMTESAGFGGVRRIARGGATPVWVAGVDIERMPGGSAQNRYEPVVKDPESFFLFKSDYAIDPTSLPNGRIVVSRALDANQDYDLFTMKADGSDLQPLYSTTTTAELRARVVAPRVMPPVRPDRLSDDNLSADKFYPPAEADSTDPVVQRKYGTFKFVALNVYANAPIDTDIISAMPVGSALKIRFFMDHQRTAHGSFPKEDWPILLGEKKISASGFVMDDNAPADLPLFEQIRDRHGRVPFNGGKYHGDTDGLTHVAGMNYGKPGKVARCVGCHAGHTMISLPPDTAEGNEAASWSNLAPGASVVASSNNKTQLVRGLIDRRVMKGNYYDYWRSESGKTNGENLTLTFDIPVLVKSVVLYAPRPEDGKISVKVAAAKVELLDGNTVLATQQASDIALTGTTVSFNAIRATSVRVTFDNVTGTFDGQNVASLAEIEVIARGTN